MAKVSKKRSKSMKMVLGKRTGKKNKQVLSTDAGRKYMKDILG